MAFYVKLIATTIVSLGIFGLFGYVGYHSMSDAHALRSFGGFVLFLTGIGGCWGALYHFGRRMDLHGVQAEEAARTPEPATTLSASIELPELGRTLARRPRPRL